MASALLFLTICGFHFTSRGSNGAARAVPSPAMASAVGRSIGMPAGAVLIAAGPWGEGAGSVGLGVEGPGRGEAGGGRLPARHPGVAGRPDRGPLPDGR